MICRRWRAAATAEQEGNEVHHVPGVCGGAACVGNTRIPVWSLVEKRRLGASDQQILDNYPSLTAAHLRAAWSYYEAHREEIEDAIAEQDDE